MNLYRKMSIIILTLSSINSASAITLIGDNTLLTTNPTTGLVVSGVITDISPGNTQTSTINDQYNIFVDGDLFLDYSVFSNNQDLFINSNISITGQTVNIFSFYQEPTMPNLSLSTIFQNPDLSINETGSLLIYSDTPISNGIFEATNNVYVGNFSSINPVPLPASFLLFISGLVALIYKSPLTKRLWTPPNRP